MIDLSEVAGIELQVDQISDKTYLKTSGVYTAEIAMAYMTESKGGATGIQIDFVTEKNEVYKTQNFWVTNRSGNPFYVIKAGKKKGEKALLPGMNDLMKYCELITGNKEEFNITEDTVYPVYDKEKQAEVDTTVKSVPGLVGKVVQIVLQQTVEDKTALNSGSGKYEPTGETKVVLALKTILDGATGKTLAEKNAKLEAKYKNTFLGKIAENPIYTPKNVVGKAPVGADGKDSGEHKPKVNADDNPEADPFGN